MEKDFKNVDPQDVSFEDLENIDAYTCVLGLSFPETATEFQKATLCLAHLMAAVRECVLKGTLVPCSVITLIDGLAKIIFDNGLTQMHDAKR